jgi:hypothetical protein
MILFFVTAKKTINKKRLDLNKLPNGEYSLSIGANAPECGGPNADCDVGGECCSGICNTIQSKCL